MRRLFLLTLAVALFLGASLSIMAGRAAADELATRLEVIEAEREDILDKLGRLVEVSGYIDGEFIMSDKPGSDNEFRLHHLSLFFKKDIAKEWRVFTEIEFEDAPYFEATDADWKDATNGKIFVEVMTIEYLYSPKLNLALGRFLTPAGIWGVEHYPPFTATQERPQHIKNIFPQLTDGLRLNGDANVVGDVVTGYYLYAGNGEGNSGSGDNNEDKAFGGRVACKMPYLTTLELGLSAFFDTSSSDTEKTALGADIKAQWKNIKFQGEYANGSLRPASGSDYDRTGYYGQLAYAVGAVDLIYRYDWYDKSDIADNDANTINTVALNYHFTPAVTGKAEHHFVSPEDPASEDYTKTIFTIALYLGE
jgi:hypothetical protein